MELLGDANWWLSDKAPNRLMDDQLAIPGARLRYAEIRAMVGGVTAIQGRNGASDAAEPLVRNVIGSSLGPIVPAPSSTFRRRWTARAGRVSLRWPEGDQERPRSTPSTSTSRRAFRTTRRAGRSSPGSRSSTLSAGHDHRPRHGSDTEQLGEAERWGEAGVVTAEQPALVPADDRHQGRLRRQAVAGLPGCGLAALPGRSTCLRR